MPGVALRQPPLGDVSPPLSPSVLWALSFGFLSLEGVAVGDGWWETMFRWRNWMGLWVIQTWAWLARVPALSFPLLCACALGNRIVCRGYFQCRAAPLAGCMPGSSFADSQQYTPGDSDTDHSGCWSRGPDFLPQSWIYWLQHLCAYVRVVHLYRSSFIMWGQGSCLSHTLSLGQKAWYIFVTDHEINSTANQKSKSVVNPPSFSFSFVFSLFFPLYFLCIHARWLQGSYGGGVGGARWAAVRVPERHINLKHLHIPFGRMCLFAPSLAIVAMITLGVLLVWTKGGSVWPGSFKFRFSQKFKVESCNPWILFLNVGAPLLRAKGILWKWFISTHN